MKQQANDISTGRGGSPANGLSVPTVNSARQPAEQSVFQLQKILVPVDFSPCSQKALDYALPFAKQFGAELILLHVIEPVVVIPVTEVLPDSDLMNESAASVKQSLEELRAKLGQHLAVRTLIRTGNPHLEIVDVAKELGIDLVILSTHGRTGLEHVLMGSTAERVVRRIGCPVLVVREYEHEFIRVNPAAI
jgi:nucleotide-binding universal stress UspA family protein